jgi:hypothetical protein
VQDPGRPGYLRVGIPASGPVDEGAFVLANRLAGNPAGAAGLECTLIGPRLELRGGLRSCESRPGARRFGDEAQEVDEPSVPRLIRDRKLLPKLANLFRT